MPSKHTVLGNLYCSFLYPHNNPVRFYYPHFTKEKAGAQRVNVTPPKSHSEYKAGWGLDPGLLTSRASAFSTILLITIITTMFEKRQWRVAARVTLS